jgi:hypothetical protein
MTLTSKSQYEYLNKAVPEEDGFISDINISNMKVLQDYKRKKSLVDNSFKYDSSYTRAKLARADHLRKIARDNFKALAESSRQLIKDFNKFGVPKNVKSADNYIADLGLKQLETMEHLTQADRKICSYLLDWILCYKEKADKDFPKFEKDLVEAEANYWKFKDDESLKKYKIAQLSLIEAAKKRDNPDIKVTQIYLSKKIIKRTVLTSKGPKHEYYTRATINRGMQKLHQAGLVVKKRNGWNIWMGKKKVRRNPNSYSASFFFRLLVTLRKPCILFHKIKNKLGKIIPYLARFFNQNVTIVLTALAVTRNILKNKYNTVKNDGLGTPSGSRPAKEGNLFGSHAGELIANPLVYDPKTHQESRLVDSYEIKTSKDGTLEAVKINPIYNIPMPNWLRDPLLNYNVRREENLAKWG